MSDGQDDARIAEIETLRSKVACAEAWGLTFGWMKSSDRPDRYMCADIREYSDIGRMNREMVEAMILRKELDDALALLRARDGEIARLREAIEAGRSRVCPDEEWCDCGCGRSAMSAIDAALAGKGEG